MNLLSSTSDQDGVRWIGFDLLLKTTKIKRIMKQWFVKTLDIRAEIENNEVSTRIAPSYFLEGDSWKWQKKMVTTRQRLVRYLS